jgi:hypothetical protein
MNAQQIIGEIVALPPDERAEVLRFTRQLERQQELSPDEIRALAERLAETKEPDQVKALRDELTRGFYGADRHA